MTALIIKRLTLECGHLRISGPWDSPLDDDGKVRHMIGDITWCEVCPRTPEYGSHGRPVMAIREVVNVEAVAFDQYREPEPELSRSRSDRIHD